MKQKGSTSVSGLKQGNYGSNMNVNKFLKNYTNEQLFNKLAQKNIIKEVKLDVLILGFSKSKSKF
jgi:hypothetical protein